MIPASTLKFRDQGDDVKLLQTLLARQGFFDGAAQGHFLELTRSAVVHFQQTHNGPALRPLEVDGVVGPATWWALFNPSGAAQRNYRPQLNPCVKCDARAAIIRWWENEHALGVHEEPDGSNWGPRVKQYLAAAGIGFPAPWCQSTVVCADRETIGKYPPGITAGVEDAWHRAFNAGMAYHLDKYRPVPGDQFVMLHGDGTGHTGMIYRVSRDGREVNTIEGNCGNRVALQRRALASFAGVINVFGDAAHPPAFDPGLVDSDDRDERDR